MLSGGTMLDQLIVDKDYLKIQSALHLCIRAHDGQTRKDYISNQEFKISYCIHPIRIWMFAKHFLGLNNAEMECAILLHDVIEDTDISEKDIREMFGDSVCNIVLELTKTKETNLVEVSKKYSASAKIIKALDRVDNLLDAKIYFKPEKFVRYLSEAEGLYQSMNANTDHLPYILREQLKKIFRLFRQNH